MLPRVKILFENGALGSVAPSADGVCGLIVPATAGGGFQLGQPYVFRKYSDLVDTGANETSCAVLYKEVREFYAEAGDGAELWVTGAPEATSIADWTAVSGSYAPALIRASEGRIRTLGLFHTAGCADTAAITAALLAMQTLAVWATTALYAPVTVIAGLPPAKAGSGSWDPVSLPALTGYAYNRVGVIFGDTVAGAGAPGAAVGLLLGRIARIPVQRHIGRVRDLALNTPAAYVGAVKAENADVETLNDKGYITFRTFVGKAGYFFSDDSLATAVADDYRSVARRRTVDKAYRIAYATLLEFLNEEIPVTDSGNLVPAMVKSWSAEVETAIVNGMTAEGNLGADPDDAADKGVKCFIDYEQNVVATGKVEISLKVKPFGYAKYIDVKLGFLTLA